MKKTVFSVFLFTLFIYLLANPSESYLAAVDGLMLWFHTILPALLPFMIISGLLIRSGRIEAILKHFRFFFSGITGLSPCGSYALILGFFCGYPMGAKVTADLYRRDKISLQEAEYLLTFANNASPAFISNFFLFNTLHTKKHGAAVFLILYGASFLTALLYRIFFLHSDTSASRNPVAACESPALSVSLDNAVMDAFETIVKIGGYIIFFSLVSSFIHTIFSSLPCLSLYLTGFTELTTGIRQMADSSLPEKVRFLSSLCFISFGGISSIAQTRGMLSGTPLKIQTYVIAKVMNTVLTLFLGHIYLVFLAVV